MQPACHFDEACRDSAWAAAREPGLGRRDTQLRHPGARHPAAVADPGALQIVSDQSQFDREHPDNAGTFCRVKVELAPGAPLHPQEWRVLVRAGYYRR